jgi:hypothetical protein
VNLFLHHYFPWILISSFSTMHLWCIHTMSIFSFSFSCMNCLNVGKQKVINSGLNNIHVDIIKTILVINFGYMYNVYMYNVMYACTMHTCASLEVSQCLCIPGSTTGLMMLIWISLKYKCNHVNKHVLFSPFLEKKRQNVTYHRKWHRTPAKLLNNITQQGSTTHQHICQIQILQLLIMPSSHWPTKAQQLLRTV